MTTEPLRDYVLLIDKPIGPTSHDVVAQARRVLGTRRIGHTGTLDPFASGLLMLCVNKATRVAEYLTGMDKDYHASARLDGFTDTDDHTGRLVESSAEWRSLTRSDIESALASIEATAEQVPPAYSAKKVQGERAYDRARAGAALELAPVPVSITNLQLNRFAPPEIDFSLTCSSGTYVRAVARDLGRRLGTGAYLTELRRTRIGGWRVNQAIPLEQIGDEVLRASATVSLADAIAHLPAVDVTPEQVRRLAYGQGIPVTDPATPELLRAICAGQLVAVLNRAGDVLRPHKVLVTPE